MTATVAMSGGGGWPMSVFLAPDGRPFFAGTYFPKTSRYGKTWVSGRAGTHPPAVEDRA
jgi:uncharacterized protein YyaL (SSP411 family)